MAISVIQRVSGQDPNGVNGAVSAAFTSNNTNGNTIIVIQPMALTSSNTSTAISDTQGNKYGAPIYSFSNGTNFVACIVWIAYNIKAGANTVSISPDGGAVNLHVYEVVGLAAHSALDQFSQTVQSNTTALTSGAITTTRQNELLIGVGMQDVTSATYTLGGSFVNLLAQANTNFSSATEELITSNIGTYTATMTGPSAATSSLMVILSFKAGNGVYFRNSSLRPHPFSPGLAR